MDNLGNTRRSAGRLKEAITAQREAVAVFKKIKYSSGEGVARTNLGLALQETGQLEEAITEFFDAMIIFSETGDRHREVTARENLERARGIQTSKASSHTSSPSQQRRGRRNE